MNASLYLQSYGWTEGEALQKGGLRRPILVKHKKDTKGLGADGNDTDLWWERLFDGQLKNLEMTSGSDGILFKQNSSNVDTFMRKATSPLYKMFVKGTGLAGTVGKKEGVLVKSVEVDATEALKTAEKLTSKSDGKKRGKDKLTEKTKKRKEDKRERKDKKERSESKEKKRKKEGKEGKKKGETIERKVKKEKKEKRKKEKGEKAEERLLGADSKEEKKEEKLRDEDKKKGSKEDKTSSTNKHLKRSTPSDHTQTDKLQTSASPNPELPETLKQRETNSSKKSKRKLRDEPASSKKRRAL